MLVLEYECCEAPEKFVVVETEVWTTVAKVDSTWYLMMLLLYLMVCESCESKEARARAS
jgi:hypothetical protein